MAKIKKAITPKPDTEPEHVADDPTEPGISSWTFENIAEFLAEEHGYALDTAPAEFWVSVGMKAAQLHYAGEAAAAMGAEMARQALGGVGPLSEESFRTTADLVADGELPRTGIKLPEANKEDSEDAGKEEAPF